MTRMEQAALGHAAEWLRYSRSPQARIDAERDRERRAAADRKGGHTPLCSFTTCHHTCPTQNPKTPKPLEKEIYKVLNN